MKLRYLSLIIGLILPFAVQVKSEVIAKQILDRTLQLIQNPGGAQMDYELKITQLFTQSGHAIIKGSQTLTRTKKAIVWFNGKTGWWYEPKKDLVTIFGPSDKRHIGMGQQIEIAKTGCTYALESDPRGFLLRLRTINKDVSIREATILVNKSTFAPMELRFKWKIFWFSIEITNFSLGNYEDEMFTFNPKNYPNVKIVDKRKPGE